MPRSWVCLARLFVVLYLCVCLAGLALVLIIKPGATYNTQDIKEGDEENFSTIDALLDLIRWKACIYKQQQIAVKTAMIFVDGQHEEMKTFMKVNSFLNRNMVPQNLFRACVQQVFYLSSCCAHTPLLFVFHKGWTMIFMWSTFVS